MTKLPNGGTTIENLGDLKDEGYAITWYCDGKCGGRSLSLTLDKAIELWGRDRCHIAQTWTGIKCSACGSRKIGISVRAPTYSLDRYG